MARRIRVESAARGVSSLRQQFSPSLRVLLGLVGVVLLMACLNLANLALARAARWQEWGVRAALGASTWDLVRPTLIESLLLSSVGALLGLAVAYAMSHALLQMAWTGFVPTSLRITPDGRVLAFTAAVAVITGLLFALAPAWYTARINPQKALGQQTRSVRGGSGLLPETLLVGQMALSLMLVAGALLFGRTLTRLHTVDVGYRRDHLLTMVLFPQAGQAQRQTSTAYYQELAEKAKRVPGVDSVSFSYLGPANAEEDREPVYNETKQVSVQAVHEIVGPNFFRVAGMQLLSGREFTWRDDEHSSRVVIVSQSLAESLFGRESAVGRTLYLGPLAHAVPVRIVGVVNSASLWKVESVHPRAIYQPLALGFVDLNPLLDIRTNVDPHTIKTAAQHAVRSLGRHDSLRTTTGEERLDSYLTAQRITAMLAAFFGVLAVLIAVVGLYGLLSFQVARRTAELGIRFALGAQHWQVWFLVWREVLLWAGLGSILGLIATWAMGRFLAGLLFGVSPNDPGVLTMALLVLLAVAMVAGFVPARRAARVDPLTALRME